ncbi:MAG TPA: gamma-glutamyltransferase, partial [Acidimicrobiales bacterium]|nr:gamma-glutamyltransferase [Acidimicrobiales bacterium]
PHMPELGFPLGSRAQMFWLDEAHPSALAPGKRPRTTLTPSLATADGGARALSFGTPGGDGQDQWQAAMFLRFLHHGMNLQEAIDAPAFHCAHWPDSFWPRQAYPGRLIAEERFGPEVLDDLRARGHKVAVAAPWSEGSLSAILAEDVGEDGFWFKAAANPRTLQGYAAGR